jgi:large subunit ribosomal protein L25
VEKDEKGLPKSKSIIVSEKELSKLIYTPNVYIVNLDVDGDVSKVILKELQCDPVSDRPIHVDFYQITDAPIVIEVPVKLHGLAEGVKAGGKLVLNVRKLKVRAPYTSLPDTLDIDVTALTLGKSLKVGALHFEGLEIVTSKEVVVCAVRMTRAARSASSEATDEENNSSEE